MRLAMQEMAARAGELWNWLLVLDPSFSFLLALPFVVAAAGLLRYGFDRRNRGNGRHGTHREIPR